MKCPSIARPLHATCKNLTVKIIKQCLDELKIPFVKQQKKQIFCDLLHRTLQASDAALLKAIREVERKDRIDLTGDEKDVIDLTVDQVPGLEKKLRRDQVPGLEKKILKRKRSDEGISREVKAKLETTHYQVDMDYKTQLNDLVRKASTEATAPVVDLQTMYNANSELIDAFFLALVGVLNGCVVMPPISIGINTSLYTTPWAECKLKGFSTLLPPAIHLQEGKIFRIPDLLFFHDWFNEQIPGLARMTNVDLELHSSINLPTRISRTLESCSRDQVLIIPIFLRTYDSSTELKATGPAHTNFLLGYPTREGWDVYRIESHGTQFYKCVNIFIASILEETNALIDQKLTFKGYISQECPAFKPQSITKDSFCSAWSMYITFLQLINPTVNRLRLIETIRQLPRATLITKISQFIEYVYDHQS